MLNKFRTALELAGTVVKLNERLTALEGNFDILQRAVERESARSRAERSRRLKEEGAGIDRALQDPVPRAHASGEGVIGGIFKRRKPEDGS